MQQALAAAEAASAAAAAAKEREARRKAPPAIMLRGARLAMAGPSGGGGTPREGGSGSLPGSDVAKALDGGTGGCALRCSLRCSRAMLPCGHSHVPGTEALVPSCGGSTANARLTCQIGSAQEGGHPGPDCLRPKTMLRQTMILPRFVM